MIRHAIDALCDHYEALGLLSPLDREYCRNRAFSLLQAPPAAYERALLDCKQALDRLLQSAKEKQLLAGEGTAFEDDFIAKLTDIFMPRPSEYERMVHQLADPLKQTEWMYQVALASEYVKHERVQKNIHHSYQAGDFPVEITINLSKPEKSPEEIRLATTAVSGYPACLLCKENVGISDVPNPPRTHHRIYPLKLNDADFFFQDSPYAYFNEHCIIFSKEHAAMTIDGRVVDRFLDFVDLFPHYFISANADLPIVGGSILTHDHYQGGRALFPVDQATEIVLYETPDLRVSKLDWPISAVRISGTRGAVTKASKDLIEAWQGYSNPALNILARSDEQHNTLNILARKSDEYQLTLFLRNNRIDEAHPDGIFHTKKIWQVVKRENIGIIEVMGLAILPARLQEEMKCFDDLEQYRDWIKVVPKAEPLDQLGYSFAEMLKDCGVFKTDEPSQMAFEEFIRTIFKK